MMTLTAADTYIASIIGGSGDTGVLAEARESLKAAYEELLHRNNWSWLGVDTAQSFTVANCQFNQNDATVSTTTTDGFKNVLAGMTIETTGPGAPSGFTVASVTDTETLEMDANSVATAGPKDAAFGGTIPIVQGTADYKLPAPFWKPLSCRLTSTQYRPLNYMRIQNWDARSYDQSVQGAVTAYTIWDGSTFDASGTQQSYIKFIRVPSQADVALLRYWRMPTFSTTDSDPVDIPDEFLYTLLDFGRVHLLRRKDAANERMPWLTRDIEQRIARAISADREAGGDDQYDRFMTPTELDNAGIFDGNFWPRGDVIWRAGR